MPPLRQTVAAQKGPAQAKALWRLCKRASQEGAKTSRREYSIGCKHGVNERGCQTADRGPGAIFEHPREITPRGPQSSLSTGPPLS